MNSPTSIQSAALKKRITEKFAAAGWNLQFPKGGPGTDLIGGIIVCDIERQHLLMVGLSKEGLNQIRKDAAISPFDFQDYCNAFGSFLTEIQDKNPSSLTEEERRQLGILATLYITGTQTYRLAQVNPPSSEKMYYYVVLRYFDHQAQLPMLRPGAMALANMPAPEDIEEYAQALLSMDRQAHPNRFKSAEVLTFKIRNKMD